MNVMANKDKDDAFARYCASCQGCYDTDILIKYLPCFDPCVLFFCLVFCSVSSSTELG